MASGGLAAASEVAVVFLIRPVLAIAFVFTLILLGTPPLPLPPSLGYLVACAGSLIHFVRFPRLVRGVDDGAGARAAGAGDRRPATEEAL